ncbi:hypothetical protein OQA88_4498 [Cercophora sp. LCS_1]
MARPPKSKRAATARRATKPALPTSKPTPNTTGWFSSWPRWKRFTVTGLFAGTIITGAVWGAMLKMQQEVKAEQQKRLEATTDEKVAILESRKERLAGMRDELQGKIDALHAKIKARESITSAKDL